MLKLMTRLGLVMGLALIWGMGWPLASAQAQRLERVSPFLEHPWGMSFIDAQRLLVTERTGQVLLVDLGAGAATPLTGVPKVVVDGQGGMLDVLYDRGEVFLCYAGPASLGRNATTLGAGRLEGTALVGFTQMFQAANPGYGSHHYGCRIGLDPAGKLYLTLGDRGTANSAQETDNHQGAVIRL
ncbi:MAG: PQQ-dependent sugar dehydrogenase, partial [Pseudomonadota bacterium]|nr:PQQ-dependent sugar dehydrogenase [Pseudomonadota bacterium]